MTQPTDVHALVVSLLRDLVEEWELDGWEDEVDEETCLIADLGLTSVDFVDLFVSIEKELGRSIGFHDLLMVDGKYVSDLSLGELTEFTEDRLASDAETDRGNQAAGAADRAERGAHDAGFTCDSGDGAALPADRAATRGAVGTGEEEPPRGLRPLRAPVRLDSSASHPRRPSGGLRSAGAPPALVRRLLAAADGLLAQQQQTPAEWDDSGADGGREPDHRACDRGHGTPRGGGGDDDERVLRMAPGAPERSSVGGQDAVVRLSQRDPGASRDGVRGRAVHSPRAPSGRDDAVVPRRAAPAHPPVHDAARGRVHAGGFRRARLVDVQSKHR